MAGGLYAYTPGEEIPVYVEEDAEGNLPDRGDFVTVTGETADYTVVQLADDGDVAIGQVLSFDNHDNGDPVAGPGSIVSGKPITYAPVADGYAAAAGDEVCEGAGGVRDYDAAVTDGTETETPFGVVFSTVTREFGVGDKVAVANYR